MARTIMVPVWIRDANEIEDVAAVETLPKAVILRDEEVTFIQTKEVSEANSEDQVKQQLGQCIPPGGDCVASRNCCPGYYCYLQLPIPRCVKSTKQQAIIAAN